MKKILLLTIASFFLLQSNAQTWIEKEKIVASSRAPFDRFGVRVSMSGNFAIIGAPSEDEDASGGNPVPNAGAAYIFELDTSGNWNQIQKIVASDRDTSDGFGLSVSISGDYAIIGAADFMDTLPNGTVGYFMGAAYIFERDVNGIWSEAERVISSDRSDGEQYAQSVSISGDFAIVGVYFDTDTIGGNFRLSVGSAFIYERDGSGNWNEAQKLRASDRAYDSWFGSAVSIDGNTAFIGAAHESRDSSGGNVVFGAGAAYVFVRDSSGYWNETQKIVTPDRDNDDFFGFDAISLEGDRAIVGAYNDRVGTPGNPIVNGSAYIYERDASGIWYLGQKVTASDPGLREDYGFSVSISGDVAVVGASRDFEDDMGGNALKWAGSVYIYERDINGNWSQRKKLLASDRDSLNFFGASVCIDGNRFIVGAPGESEDASGMNTVDRAGAAYVYEYDFCSLDTSVSQQGFTLTSNLPTGTYQWLDCDAGNSPIAGATSQSFTASLSGNFAVAISQNGCADTSACQSICIETKNIFPEACRMYTSPSGRYTWSSSGTYSDTLYNAMGCDSIYSINLTIDSVDTSVDRTHLTLIAHASTASYQWLDCDNGYAPVSGQTFNSFTPIMNGNYAVEVTQNNCVDTSVCYSILNVGISSNEFGPSFQVFPNPTSGKFNITLGKTYNDIVIIVRNLTGQAISSQKFDSTDQFVIEINGPAGMYFAEIKTLEGKSAIVKVLKK